LTPCQDGLVCGIELFADEDDEPDQGVCEPLAPIGEPCVPTFGRAGRCVEGGTCDSRPSGDCVPLREVGESRGYTQCVDGAYCQIYSAITDVESHMCYVDRQRGEPCFGQDVICAEGLECLCPGEDCVEEICEVAREYGEPCDGVTELCSGSIECSDGICGGRGALIPDGPPPAVGEPCVRTLSFGRISGNCSEDDLTIECLCTDIDCAEAYCGIGRIVGESCNNRTELCRYGYACENDVCVPLDSLDLDGRVCGP
jgi:hypothetical protein